MSTRDPTDFSHRPDLALSDFVLAFTKTLLRPGGFSREQSEAMRAVEGVQKAFTDLMNNRGGELSFELSQPTESSVSHDVLIDDGVNQQYLKQILTQGVAETFVAKLVSFFDSHRLLLLTLKKGMTRRDFETMLEKLTQNQAKGPDRAIEMTGADLAQAGVSNAVLVPDSDRISQLRGRIPWRAEIMLARIQREARAIPTIASAWNEDPVDLERRTFDSIFNRKHELENLQAIAVHLPSAIDDARILGEIDKVLLGTLSPASLAPFATVLSQSDAHGSAEESDRRRDLIKGLVGRLLVAGTPDAMNALVTLREAGLVEESALTDAERRLVRAAALARACLRSTQQLASLMDHTSANDPYAEAIDDLELATLGLVQQRQWRLATSIFGVLREFADGKESAPPGGAARALSSIKRLGQSTIGSTIHRTLISPRESNAKVQELLALLEPAEKASILKQVLRDTPEISLRQWAVDQLVEVAPSVPGFLASAIGGNNVPQGLLRNLFNVVRRTRDDGAFDAVQTHLGSERGQLRSESLQTLAELSMTRARIAVQKGLEDASADVRRVAAQALARGEDLEEVTIDALIVVGANETEEESVRAAALGSLGQLGALDSNQRWRPKVLDALRAIVQDKHGGALKRFKRLASSRKAPPSSLLVAACRGIGPIGLNEDLKLLRSCLSDDNPEVRQAAQKGIERLEVTLSMRPG